MIPSLCHVQPLHPHLTSSTSTTGSAIEVSSPTLLMNDTAFHAQRTADDSTANDRRKNSGEPKTRRQLGQKMSTNTRVRCPLTNSWLTSTALLPALTRELPTLHRRKKNGLFDGRRNRPATGLKTATRHQFQQQIHLVAWVMRLHHLLTA